MGILNVAVSKRYTMDEVAASSWFRIPNPLLDENGMCSDPQVLAEKMKSKLEIVEDDSAGYVLSACSFFLLIPLLLQKICVFTAHGFAIGRCCF